MRLDELPKLCNEKVFIRKSKKIYGASNNKNKTAVALWNCIIDSFAFICRKVYDAQGAKYYPEPIELVDDNTLKYLNNRNLRSSALRIRMQ